MKKFWMGSLAIIAGLSVLGAMGQATMSPEEKARLEFEQRAKEAVRSVLRDPWSAAFEHVTVTKTGDVCGRVNAKNGFGGYTGFQFFVWVRRMNLPVIEGHELGQKFYFDKKWKESCALS